MAQSKRKFEAEMLALPPLHLILGAVPAPDPDQQNGAFHAFGREAPQQARQTLTKLIGHLKEKK